MKVILEYPIELPGEVEGEIKTIKELTFTRIKTKHIKLIPVSCFKEGGGEMLPAEVIPLIAGLANISEEQADEIDLVDLRKITGEVLPTFLSGFQPAKKKEEG